MILSWGEVFYLVYCLLKLSLFPIIWQMYVHAAQISFFPASEISAKISLLEQVVNFEPIWHFMGETLPQTTFSAAPHLNEPVKDQISVLELLQ